MTFKIVFLKITRKNVFLEITRAIVFLTITPKNFCLITTRQIIFLRITRKIGCRVRTNIIYICLLKYSYLRRKSPNNKYSEKL